ncbi:S24 family peptidase [Sphingobacterium deserti]|uniref:Peptidase S24/S26A/S26B n=1 Tax=Sphingobacterium deserti TaxID=1229276 RepID=A0A0B8T683_9SPHI|nr:S24 family peptidase [Sphingobacterium deserti]KGE12590.1 peptidase S24/S26A/S26B [Sphingobacterium deserti]
MIRRSKHIPQQIISGFKSPADDYLEARLDVNDLLVVDPHCTFYFKMDSDAMLGYHIPENAVLIVDRSLSAISGAVVIAALHGELLCRSLQKVDDGWELVNDRERLAVGSELELVLWGVVTAVCYGVLPQRLKVGRYKRVCTL